MASTSNGLRDNGRALQALRSRSAAMLGLLRRTMFVAPLLFALATFGIAGYLIAKDRQDTLLRVGERTSSMARMIMAHGEAAADNAEQIISRVSDRVAAWDLTNEAMRAEIASSLREAVSLSAVASGAAVVDARGHVVLNTVAARTGAQDVSARPFWQDHLAGQDDPVIRSDTDPDLRNGTSQFTYSRALRNPGGDLHAVIVVTVFASNFETLYRETANWPSARAGLYTVSGDVLARVRDPQVQKAITEITNNLLAVAEAHRLVHSAASLETVDIVEALKGLCRHLEQTYGRPIAFRGHEPVMIDAAHATTLSVIANELATNAIKYGKGRIELTCLAEDRIFLLSVTNAHGALPEGFDLGNTEGFGLRAVCTMLVALAQSTFTGRNVEPDGVSFEVTVPMKALEPKRRPAVRL